MTKYKATINIDRELWDEFRAYCKNFPKCSASELLRTMISDELEKADPDYPSFFRSPLSPSIQAEIESIKHRLDKLEAEGTEEIPKLDGLKTEGTEGTEGTEEIPKLDGLKTEETEVQKRFKKMTSKYSPEQRYSNQLVSEVEGLSPSMISAYRTGRKKPKDDGFFQRWQISPVKGWEAIKV